jgi:hypothetical protein
MKFQVRGSFAEGFTGDGVVTSVAVFLTTANSNSIPRPDIYVWESVDSSPGPVIAVVPDVHWGPIAFWPAVNRHEVAITAPVTGAFFAGIWPNYGDDIYYVAADTNGPGGQPRTKVPEGQAWPVGWYDVDQVVEGGAQAMGIEVQVESNPTPVRSTTWGRVKAMYR